MAAGVGLEGVLPFAQVSRQLEGLRVFSVQVWILIQVLQF